LAVEAAKVLQTQGVSVRVVSMPCCERFNAQDEKYRESVLPKNITARIAIEAGVPDCWYRFVGNNGKIMGIKGFGTSAPYKEAFREYGFTVESVVSTVNQVNQENFNDV